MSNCAGKEKAIIEFRKISNNSRFRVEVTPTPIEIKCLDGAGIIECKASGYIPFTCTPDGAYGYGGNFNASSYKILGTRFDFPDAPGCPIYIIEFQPSGQIIYMSTDVRFRVIEPPSSNGTTGIEVRNGNGQVVFKQFDIDCNVKISCDEECPPGHIKCCKNSYPGYCCIPCNEIKSEIISLKNQVKNITNV